MDHPQSPDESTGLVATLWAGDQLLRVGLGAEQCRPDDEVNTAIVRAALYLVLNSCS